MRSFLPLPLFLHFALLLCCTPALAGISGTATVEPGTGEFADYWCYTIEFTWDSPQGLSHLSAFVGLEGLECACEPGLFVFPLPAGSTTGSEDGIECTLEYLGEYVCFGDPSLPGELTELAAVKFEPSPETCDAGTTGSGWVTFCSLLGPGNEEFHDDVIVVKSGTGTVVGDISGLLPAADCSVGAHDANWGAVKALFERE